MYSEHALKKKAKALPTVLAKVILLPLTPSPPSLPRPILSIGCPLYGKVGVLLWLRGVGEPLHFEIEPNASQLHKV